MRPELVVGSAFQEVAPTRPVLDAQERAAVRGHRLVQADLEIEVRQPADRVAGVRRLEFALPGFSSSVNP